MRAALSPRSPALTLALAAAAALLGGCSSTLPPPASAFAVPLQVASPPLPPSTGAIYSGRHSDNWYGRGRNFLPGDVITVLLAESAQAQRSNNASVSRASKNDVIPPGVGDLLGRVRGVPSGLNLNSANVESKGAGAADQSAELNGSVSVTVIEVQPNGNLLVRGEKRLTLGSGAEVIQVTGVIRPGDVAPNNTVQSRRLAQADITYRAAGELADAAQPGWGTRGLLRWWPF